MNPLPSANMPKINKQQFISEIKGFLPTEALDFVFDLFDKSNFSLKITPPRITKKGDYRPPSPRRPALITLNGDLVPYEFLLVFLHEVAHYQAFEEIEKHRKKIEPHGIEWKTIYKTLIENLLETVSLPEEVSSAFRQHILNIKSSSSLDKTLNELFSKDAPVDENATTADKLQPNDLFIFRRHIFRFKEKRRTRILCTRLDNRREYSMPGQAPVIRYQAKG
jgi:hypothetical protein